MNVETTVGWPRLRRARVFGNYFGKSFVYVVGGTAAPATDSVSADKGSYSPC